jgi:MFS family permease
VGTAWFVGIALQGIVCGSFCAFIANEKNRDGLGWFLLGLIFGIFALIAIASVPRLEKQEHEVKTEATPAPSIVRGERLSRDFSLIPMVLIGLCILLISITAYSTL